MSKEQMIKDLGQRFENEYSTFKDYYKDALQLYETIEKEGADYHIMMDPYNEQCELATAHCKLAKQINEVEASRAELEVDEMERESWMTQTLKLMELRRNISEF